MDLLTPSVKHSLSIRTRDETMKLLLHAFLKQPRFFLFGLRALLYPFPVKPDLGKIIKLDFFVSLLFSVIQDLQKREVTSFPLPISGQAGIG